MKVRLCADVEQSQEECPRADSENSLTNTTRRQTPRMAKSQMIGNKPEMIDGTSDWGCEDWASGLLDGDVWR